MVVLAWCDVCCALVVRCVCVVMSDDARKQKSDVVGAKRKEGTDVLYRKERFMYILFKREKSTLYLYLMMPIN